MKDTRIFKVRRKQDGLFATKHKWKGIDWSTTGSMWRGMGALKLAFREGTLRQTSFEDVDIVVYELVEKEVVKWQNLKSINEG